MDPARRIELLTALSDVFRKRGYEGATLAELAAAASLGRASLYHHFPGGKAEMAAQVLDACSADLERLAYRRLRAGGPWNERIAAFVDGFGEYVEQGARNCLLAAMTASGGDALLGDEIAQRTAAWIDELAAVFAESGLAPKRATRSARELLGRLYGALALAQLLDQPKVYRQAIKRLSNQLQV